MNQWPKPGKASLDAFYGAHVLGEGSGTPTAAWESAHLATFIPPFRMVLAWNHAQRISVVKCHRLVLDSLRRIFSRVWAAYGSQAAIEAAGLHLWGGCYEYRKVWNSNNLSTHAWGAGVDWNPDANPRGRAWKPGVGMMPEVVIAAFQAEGWAWGGRFANPDAMHFEAVSRASAGSLAVGAANPGAVATDVAPPEPTMSDALTVPPFPSIQDTVDWEGAHVYGTLAGQMRQYGYREFEPAPATPAPVAVRNAWRTSYPACRNDALRMWVLQLAGNHGILDPLEARAWWIKKGYGPPEREVARRLAWFTFEVLGVR